jgi:hypothetical protein
VDLDGDKVISQKEFRVSFGELTMAIELRKSLFRIAKLLLLVGMTN